MSKEKQGADAASRSRVHSNPEDSKPRLPTPPPAQSPSAPGVSSPRGERLGAEEAVARGGLGSPARRIGPGKQHPFPLLLAPFNSHSARATPCRHRPLGQRLSAPQPGLGRGREGGGASEGPPRPRGTTKAGRLCGRGPPPFSHHSARVSRGSANGGRAREKGRPGPDAPQESHARCAGAAGSSVRAPSLPGSARLSVRPSRFPSVIALLFPSEAPRSDAGGVSEWRALGNE